MPDLMPIVDAHVHFWDPTTQNYPWLCEKPRIPFRYGDYSGICRPYFPSEHVAALTSARIVKAVYIEAEWDPNDPIGEMAFIAKMRDETGFPSVAVAQAWLDADGVAETLERLAAFGFVRGVRHKPWGNPHHLDHRAGAMLDARWREGFAKLGPLGLRFDLQTPWWHLHEAADLARAFPETQIILLHTGLPSDRTAEGLSRWKEAMSLAAACPNIAVKISGIGIPGKPWTVEGNRDVVLTTINLFGVDRCMFGSNFPVDGVCADLETIYSGYLTITADFSDADRAKLFHDNAVRFYDIP